MSEQEVVLVEEQKELHYCEKCSKETWFTREEIKKRGILCPSGCLRNFLIFLGDNPEMIAKRKMEFIEKEGYTFEVNPYINDSEDFTENKVRVRKVGEDEEEF